MDKIQLTIILLVTSLGFLWIIAGIINYFVIKHYTNNKKVAWMFAFIGFLGSIIIGFLGFTKLIDLQEINDDLKREFSRSKPPNTQEYDWIEESEQINANGEKVITKNFYYKDKLIKSETLYENEDNKNN